MLEQVAHFNDLSPKLLKKLEDRIKSFGKAIRYKFDISHDNPDPEKYNGKTVWPFRYTLDPITFDIVDQEEKRDGKQKLKKIGLINKVTDKGVPESFFRVRVEGREQGIKKLDLENPEHVKMAMYIELHPKLKGGDFADKNRQPVITRVDERKAAEESKAIRTAKALALSTATGMSDAKVLEFARALQWTDVDSEEPLVLRDKVEALAETDPKLFNDLVTGEKMAYLAVVQKAVGQGLIVCDPAEGRWTWGSTDQPITLLGNAVSDKTDIDRFAEWLMTSGKSGEDVYNKIKSLA